MNWHRRLTQAREAKGLKKSAFAKLVGVSAPTVTDWESGGTKMIEGANLVKVCSVLGITSAWLIDGDTQIEQPQAKQTGYDPIKARMKLEHMVALQLISERDAKLLEQFWMCTEDAKGVLELSAQALDKQELLSIVDNKFQGGAPGA